MRFASLGSGSRGNATLVERGDTLLMVDCGFSCAEAERRLQRLGRTAAQLSAILVTHEHADHIGGVARLARRHRIPVWMTAGTAAMHRDGEIPEQHGFNGHEAFAIGELEIHPYPVPHDAREPCQFVFSDGAHRLGILTDAGSVTEHMVRSLDGCDALLLECNHDPHMLATGPYSPRLKARVGGRLGHLSNPQAADLLARLDSRRLQHLVAAHLSDKNNTPDLARQALQAVTGGGDDGLVIADQAQGFSWRELAVSA
jgi:phosphoribosyl 1,2-cyclic phosphodiesterase